MNELKNIELISNYENGKLSEAELKEFKQKLQTDSDFNKLYQDYVNSLELLKVKELFDVHKELEKYDYGNDSFFSKNKSIIIVSLAGLLLSGTLSVFYVNKPEKEQKPFGNSIPVIQNMEEEDTMNKTIAIIESKSKKEITADNSKTPFKAREEIKDEILIINDSLATSLNNADIITDQEVNQIDKKEIEIVTSQFDCASDKINVEYHIEPACIGKATGTIHIKKVSGLSNSYSITMNGKDSFINSANFSELSSGRHNILISDKHNCVTNYPIEVNSIACSEVFEVAKKTDDFILYIPGESWKIPMDSESQLVEIRNQNGELVFRKTINNNDTEEWNGYHMNGHLLPSGLYYYSIKDLIQSKVRTGSITIISN